MGTMIGRTLADFEIRERLGAGGMGVVYLAMDTKLRREVALKVLSDEFANNADRLRRFEREARLLASLNHPNIAAIYGLGEAEGVTYLVLEMVPGKTLAEKLAGGPLPVEKALGIAYRLAQALEFAHEHGIIHRDLKPDNIKITHESNVKILDFGIAKAFHPDPGDASFTDAGTMTVATAEHQVIGTGPYMSPEQLRGEPVTKRADIFAFGCVLFEMLTARRAFAGETLFDTVANVLKAEPEWRLLPAETPENIKKLMERCLRKDAKQRLRDIGDAAIELEETLVQLRNAHVDQASRAAAAAQNAPATPATAAWDKVASAPAAPASAPLAAPVSPTPPASAQRGRRSWLVPVALLIAVAGGVAAWQFLGHGKTALAPKASEARPAAPSPPHALFHTGEVLDVAFSPDGKVVASAGADRTTKLWDVSSGRTTQDLPGAVGRVTSLAFSPDGHWLATASEDGAVRIWATATAELRVLPGPRGAVSAVAFSPDGSLLSAAGEDRAIRLWSIPDFHEKPALAGHSDWVRALAFSRAGGMLASGGDDRTVRLWDTTAGKQVRALPQSARGVASLAFTPDGTALAAGTWRKLELWDLASGKPKWSAPAHQMWVSTLAFSPDGKELASGSGDQTVKLWDVETGKTVQTLSGHARGISSVRFSPDGKLLASGSWDSTIKIWDAESGKEVKTLGKAEGN